MRSFWAKLGVILCTNIGHTDTIQNVKPIINTNRKKGAAWTHARCRILYVILLLIIFQSASFARIWYVRPGPSGSGNGSSWANASWYVSTVMNLAVAGDEIWISKGDYTSINFNLKSDVKIYGGFSGDGTETSINDRDLSKNETNFTNCGLQSNTTLSSNTLIDGISFRGYFSTNQVSAPAIAINNSSNIKIVHCKFYNLYNNSNTIKTGGILVNGTSSPIISDCIFYNNTSQTGSAIYIDNGSKPTIINCTFSNNTNTNTDGAAIYISGNVTTGNITNIYNSIVYNNTPYEISEAVSGYLNVQSSDIKNGYTGTNNINLDPKFKDASNANYKLLSNSPCLQVGDNTVYNAISDISTSIDINSSPRLSLNIAGTSSTIDMGAYQFKSAPSNLSNNLTNILTKDISVANIIPYVDGITPITYSLDKTLPAGLTLDGATGSITGTPTAVYTPTVLTLTATNSAGTTSTTFHLAVQISKPNISYTTPVVYTLSETISPTLNPINTGGSITGGVSSVPRKIDISSINNPSGIVFDRAGNLFILSTSTSSTNSIYKLTPTGNLSVFATGFTDFSTTGFAIDGLDNLYVANRTTKKIHKITPVGAVSIFVNGGNLTDPWGLVVAPDGYLYVADNSGNKIVKIDLSNGNQSDFATNLSTFMNYNGGPKGITSDANNNLYVANGEGSISKIDHNGIVYKNFGVINKNGDNLLGLAFDSNGYLYLSYQRDDIIGNASLQKMNSIGDYQFITTLAGLEHETYGLQFNTNGDLYQAVSETKSFINVYEKGNYQIQPALPAGLSFDTNTGIISGTPTAIAAASNYTITATNSSGSSSYTINLEVKGTLLYNTPNVYTKGTAITALTPNTNGVTANTYTVSPALPAGLSIDAATGTISGTPTALSAQTEYTVTAVATSGNLEGKLKITINDVAPSNLIYTTPNVYTKGTTISNLTPSVNGGVVTNYSISPALPTGLSINASTGVISGTPTVLATSAVYTVTASNTGGSTSFGINITVNDVAPSNLSYPSPKVFSKGIAITTQSPTISGGPVVSYAVNPALPSGLSLNTTNGKITGTPTITSSSAIYTVTATNTGGSSSFGIDITVLEIPVITNFDNLVKTYGNSNFTISATSTSPGAISYTSSNTNIATITNLGVVHIVNAGTITITLNQAASGSFAATTQTISLFVNKAPLDIISDTLIKIVGQTDPTFTFTIGQNGFVNNDNASSLSGSISRTPAGETTGSYTTAINTLTSSNYNINFTPASFYIKTNTILSLADITKTYGDNDFELIAQTNSSGFITYASSDNSIVSLNGNGFNIASILKSGTVTITVTQEKTNYNTPATTTARITVNKAPLDIEAIPVTKRRRDADPALPYYIGNAGHGFTRGDNSTGLTGTLSRTAGEALGDYPITIGTLSSDKYYFNFTTANFTIIPNISRRYVVQDATGDGTSWLNASGNIQSMIDSCYSGDSIWIAKGNYKTTQSYIMKEGVHLFGGFKGDEDSIQKRDWLQNEVVIQSNVTNQPVLNYQNANLATILDGVTIKGDINNPNAVGIKTYNSNLNLNNSKIVNITSQNEAGLHSVSSTINGYTININNCTFSGNRTTLGGGGAILNQNNKIIIKNSLFNNNYSTNSSAGAIVDSSNASISILNSTFYNNTSSNGSDPFYMNPATTIANSIVMDSIENGSNYTNVTYSLVSSGVRGLGNKYFGSNKYQDIFDTTFKNFTLSPRSIAIDAGDPQTNATSYAIQVGNKDLGVQNRIKWGVVDLGAYEYQSLKPTDIVFADTAMTFGNGDFELTATSNANAPIVYSISDTTNAILYQNVTNNKWYIKAKDYGSLNVLATVAQVDPFTSATKTSKLTINPNTLRYTKDTVQCGNLIWNNITYDKTGVYSQFFKHIRAGVDSIATMNFTYKPYPAVPVITNKIKNVFATTPQFKESVGNTYSNFTNDSANLDYAYTHQLCSNSPDTIYLQSSSPVRNTWYLNGVPLNSDTLNILKVRKAGNYRLDVTLNGCVTSSEIDSVFTSDVTGSGLSFKDSLICKASFVPIVANAKWEGFDLNTFTKDSHVAYFKWSSQSGKFVDSVYNPKLSLPDTYYVKIFARGCLINDTVRIRNTADTAVVAKMMMTEQAFVNQNIKAVNITKLPAQKFEWILPDGISNSNMRPKIISTSDSAFVIKFTQEGGSIIGLRATSQDVCVTTDYARIAISNSDSSAVVNNQKVIIRDIVIGPNPSITGIFSMKVYLNALAPIAMRVVSINGRSYIIKQINPTNKTHQESIDLSGASPGTYVVILQTANGYEIRTLLNKM